jgi:Fe-S cluster biosynthesis and repair protein YggX
MEQIFRMLREFESVASPNTFKLIFGEMGAHLWNKFSFKCDHNLIKFTRILDNENNKKLMDYFDQPIQKSKKMVEFLNN